MTNETRFEVECLDAHYRNTYAYVEASTKEEAVEKVEGGRRAYERPVPEVGMGASYGIGTDTDAYTVVAVSKSGKVVTLQQDKATLLNGMTSEEPDALQFAPGGFVGHVSGTQRYEFERDPNGRIVKVSLREMGNGRFIWKRVGTPKNQHGCEASIGKRYQHYDYNF